jgi:hypothetical protein
METHALAFPYAIVGTLGLFVVAFAVYRFRQFLSTRQLPAAAPSSESLTKSPQELAARAAERREKEQRDLLLKAGKILPDGRPKCQASLRCMDPAEHARPRIERASGIGDFIRRQFGAPERYRMVEPAVARREPLAEEQHAPGRGLKGALVTAWSGQHEPRDPSEVQPELCKYHVHVARQVCSERLAEDEYRHAAFAADRETGLAIFETEGMLREVKSRVASRETAERSKGEARHAEVIPFTRTSSAAPARLPQRTNGASNGASNGKGLYS